MDFPLSLTKWWLIDSKVDMWTNRGENSRFSGLLGFWLRRFKLNSRRVFGFTQWLRKLFFVSKKFSVKAFQRNWSQDASNFYHFIKTVGRQLKRIKKSLFKWLSCNFNEIFIHFQNKTKSGTFAETQPRNTFNRQSFHNFTLPVVSVTVQELYETFNVGNRNIFCSFDFTTPWLNWQTAQNVVHNEISTTHSSHFFPL